MDDHSSCITRETTTDGGALRTVVRFDEPLQKRLKEVKDDFGVKHSTGSHPNDPNGQYINWLTCEIAVLNREIQALRTQMEWQAQHIHNLEMRLLNGDVR